MDEFQLYYTCKSRDDIDPVTMSNIIRLPGVTCKILLSRLSVVENRRLVAVLWDHGSLFSPTHKWPLSQILNLEGCKRWMENLTAEECGDIIHELQRDGLLKGIKTRIPGSVVSDLRFLDCSSFDTLFSIFILRYVFSILHLLWRSFKSSPNRNHQRLTRMM